MRSEPTQAMTEKRNAEKWAEGKGGGREEVTMIRGKRAL